MFFQKIILTSSLLFLLLFSGMAWARSGSSGLPVPRFVSLKSDEVNVRTGPGTRYPILWVYRRAGMPVEVIEEFDMWRRIRDIEGTIGWVHKSMVEGRRNAVVRGKNAQLLRYEENDESRPLLKIEPMVTVRLVECGKNWCRVQVGGHRGWIRKKNLWGVYPEETLK